MDEMTKQEELKNLDAIEMLILKAGDDSYTAQAFKNCVKIARDNVVNDFWNSPVDAAHNLEQKLNESRECNESLKRDVLALERDKEELAAKLEGKRKEQEKFSAAYNDMMNRMNTAENENEKLKQEVLKLKAKLFDLLCKDF